jgi:hypothetical protein
MGLCAIAKCSRPATNRGFCSEHGSKDDLTYTDENGNKMYGYSQTSLDKLTRAIYIMVGFQIVLLILAYTFIDYFNIIDYVAFKFKEGC